MLPYGFATLAELKARLGISPTLLDHDAVLQEIMNGVSGAIEALVGRQLRRYHRLVEYFTGGEYLIRTRMFPIAKVHSVRESDTRDFETAANYEELTEDATDGFMLDRGTRGREPGASGFIRRLGQKWLGDKDDPGMVRVEYTGGYKCEEETALENAVITLSGADVIDYGIKQVAAGEDEPVYTLEESTNESVTIGKLGGVLTRRGFIRFSATGVLSVWNFIAATLTLTMKATEEGGIVNNPQVYAIQQDPLMCGQLGTVWSSPYDASSALAQEVYGPFTTDWLTKTLQLLPYANANAVKVVFQETLKTGFLGLAIVGLEEEGKYHHFAATEHVTSAYRPSLEIEHGRVFSDPFSTPDDLRHAALIQSAHDWQTRRHPGMTGQSMRGVAIASGASYMKQPSHLLPEVQDIAQRYRQYR